LSTVAPADALQSNENKIPVDDAYNGVHHETRHCFETARFGTADRARCRALLSSPPYAGSASGFAPHRQQLLMGRIRPSQLFELLSSCAANPDARVRAQREERRLTARMRRDLNCEFG